MTIFNRKGGSFSTYLDNIYSFTNIINHEILHQYNSKDRVIDREKLSNHVYVYINSIAKTSFLQAPINYQRGSVYSLARYILNMDKKKINAYTFQEIKDRIDDFNNLHNGYKLNAPIVNGNIKFDPGETYFKYYWTRKF